jgi:hypothetical protein
VTLIPIAVIIWVSRQTLLEQAQQQIGTRLEDSVVQIGKSMDEFMFNSIRNIQTVAADPDLISLRKVWRLLIVTWHAWPTPFRFSIKSCW